MQGIMVVVFVKITIQFKMMNPCRRISFKELAVALSWNSVYNHKE